MNEPQPTADPLAVNRAAWDAIAGRDQGRTALPRYGPLCPTEEELGLLGEVRGARVLELGCGDGRSLAYLAGRGAAELCGVDLSPAQIAAAAERLAGAPATLHVSPMERDPGLPPAGFDLVVSIYALGWATDLAATLRIAARAMRPGALFVASFEHPLHAATTPGARPALVRPYHMDGPIELRWHDLPIVMQARPLSAYVNAAIAAGLAIERLLEPGPRADAADFPRRYYSREKARLVPTTFILIARKPRG